MIQLVHNLSEFTGRPGPFQPDIRRFEDFNPPKARAAARLRLIEELIDSWEYSEQEARIQAHLDQADWQGVARYHVCIFSNFLTKRAQVLRLASELTHVFRALKPRGIVIIVGGTGPEYAGLYEKLDEVARESNVQRVNGVPPTLSCDYSGAEAEQIKQLYNSVFSALEQAVVFDDLKKNVPRDLWDPDAPLRGPKAFGIRVYRAPNRPVGTRFTKRRHLTLGGSD